MTGRIYHSKPIVHRMGQVFATSVIATCLTVTSAPAANCIDQVEEIAHDFKLDIDLPVAGTDITPEDLAQSGGVIEPPAVGDSALIEPPTPNSAMPTTPELPSVGGTTSDTRKLDASDRLLLEGILISARSEAERGDIERCFNRLQKARDVIKDRTGKS